MRYPKARLSFTICASRLRESHKSRHAMRLLMIAALLTLAAVPASADVVVDPQGPWPERINTCVDVWFGATLHQQGTMSYRQFILKCVGGRTALPVKTQAACNDGNSSTGNTPGGACAMNAGVAQWLN